MKWRVVVVASLKWCLISETTVYSGERLGLDSVLILLGGVSGEMESSSSSSGIP